MLSDPLGYRAMNEVGDCAGIYVKCDSITSVIQYCPGNVPLQFGQNHL